MLTGRLGTEEVEPVAIIFTEVKSISKLNQFEYLYC